MRLISGLQSENLVGLWEVKLLGGVVALRLDLQEVLSSQTPILSQPLLKFYTSCWLQWQLLLLLSYDFLSFSIFCLSLQV